MSPVNKLKVVNSAFYIRSCFLLVSRDYHDSFYYFCYYSVINLAKLIFNIARASLPIFMDVIVDSELKFYHTAQISVFLDGGINSNFKPSIRYSLYYSFKIIHLDFFYTLPI